MTNLGCRLMKKRKISTHTPVRVWQYQKHIQTHRTEDFNSHTREGVTHNQLLRTQQPKFQLTHPWGCDYKFPNGYYISWISTHTPVRVWLRHIIKIIIGSIFQLTHPWGCDSFGKLPVIEIMYFNSHTREGVTWYLRRSCVCRDFNSHTREGVTYG